MNEFETRINAMRRAFRAEQDQITKDCLRSVGRLNTAIGHVSTAEARDALRLAKAKAYETMRESHRVNRECYIQQLEAVNDEYRRHLEASPSRRKCRRVLALLRDIARAQGLTSLSFALDDGSTAVVSFDR